MVCARQLVRKRSVRQARETAVRGLLCTAGSRISEQQIETVGALSGVQHKYRGRFAPRTWALWLHIQVPAAGVKQRNPTGLG